jgi:hypothetical protein
MPPSNLWWSLLQRYWEKMFQVCSSDMVQLSRCNCTFRNCQLENPVLKLLEQRSAGRPCRQLYTQVQSQLSTSRVALITRDILVLTVSLSTTLCTAVHQAVHHSSHLIFYRNVILSDKPHHSCCRSFYPTAGM